MQTLAEYTHDAGYPTFTPLFEHAEGVPIPLYLAMLNIYVREESRIAVQAVRRAVAESPNATAEVVALFAEYNWRPHLVGAAAMLTGVVNADTICALWRALDWGSWVSPQLAATAFRCDPDFEREARLRIETGCPIHTKRLEDLDWVARHSAAGPISFTPHSSKALASLVAICQSLPSTAPWLERALADENISKSLAGDIDSGDRIAIDWLGGIDPVFHE